MTSEDSIPVRYVHYPEGGGAVWVQVRNRFQHIPRDMYNDEWLCVWSTRPYDAAQVKSTLDGQFLAESESGPPIALPWAAKHRGVESTDPKLGAAVDSSAVVYSPSNP